MQPLGFILRSGFLGEVLFKFDLPWGSNKDGVLSNEKLQGNTNSYLSR